jgi:hypothetical protein
MTTTKQADDNLNESTIGNILSWRQKSLVTASDDSKDA